MDRIKWDILEDGTVTIETDKVSGQNHLSADELLKQLAEVLGGGVKIKFKEGHAIAHAHSHDHNHHDHHHHH